MQMENSENMIYPKAVKPPSGISLRAIGVGLFALLVLSGLIYLVARKKEETPPPPPPIQGDVSIQAGFFTVSQSPGRITIKKGDTKPIEVKITVLPFEGFTDTVAFAVEDVVKEGQSVREQKLFDAKFASAKLESKNFEKGIMLTITPSQEILAGRYVISYRAQSSKVKKNFIVPVIIE